MQVRTVADILKDVTDELETLVDEIGVCDHEVGLCTCYQRGLVAEARVVLQPAPAMVLPPDTVQFCTFVDNLRDEVSA